MTEAQRSPARFGPDATFCAIADWLTAHAGRIDEFFSEMRYTFLHVTEEVATQDTNGLGPRARIAFEGSDRLAHNFSPKNGRNAKKLRPVEAAWQERFERLKPHCVVRTDVPYQEALKLSIWQGGMAFGMVRQPNDHTQFALPGRTAAEQSFVWMRQDDRYVSRRLEIRLHGASSASWFGENTAVLRAVEAAPNELMAHPQILGERERAYACLYQMQRPPVRVDIGRKTISVIYEGESDAARAAFARGEP